MLGCNAAAMRRWQCFAGLRVADAVSIIVRGCRMPESYQA